MVFKTTVGASKLYRISLAFSLILVALNSSAQTLTSTILSGHIASRIMALPERAYAERQQLSPIRVDGVIQRVTCDNNRCRVNMRIESVKRNTSARPLAAGSVITIIDIATKDPNADPPSRIEHHAPMIGLPESSVLIPPPCSRTEAWLRPAEPSTDPNHSNAYELMAGPFGFGPSLED